MSGVCDEGNFCLSFDVAKIRSVMDDEVFGVVDVYCEALVAVSDGEAVVVAVFFFHWGVELVGLDEAGSGGEGGDSEGEWGIFREMGIFW